MGKDEGENEWSGVSTVETSEGEEEAATEISNPACQGDGLAISDFKLGGNWNF